MKKLCLVAAGLLALAACNDPSGRVDPDGMGTQAGTSRAMPPAGTSTGTSAGRVGGSPGGDAMGGGSSSVPGGATESTQ